MTQMMMVLTLRLHLLCGALAGGIPCTGDNFPLYTWLAIMALALIALIAAVIYFCKSMKK